VHNEDKELQIKLIEIQIDHEFITSYSMGLLAIEFGIIIGLGAIYYTLYSNYILYGKPQFLFLSYATIVAMFGFAILIYLTLRRYKKQREKLKWQIEELRKKYIW